MTVFMQRTFTVLCFILLSVLTALGATVTETFTVSSSTTVPSAGDVISHTTNVSVQYGASTTSSAISNEEIPTFSLASLDDTYYIKRSGGTKKCEVNSSGAMEGVFFALTSKVDGSLTVTLYNGHSSSALSYAIYTISNNSKTLTGSTDEKIAAGSFGTHTMQVSAGVTYYFHTNGTGNMGFAGYTFTPSDSTDDSGDDDDDSSSTETPEGTMNTLKIDFSAGTGNDAYISDGYTDWYLENEIKSGGSQSKTIDGVTIKISHNTDTQADIIKRNWYKNGLKTGTEETKLVCDGIYACLEKDNASYGDGQYGATSERVAIDVTISGLEVGKYSLLAYHNYVMNASHTLPAIGVEVDGTVIKSGIQQTQQILTKADAAYSLVNFEVTEAGNDVVVTYFSEPEDGESYTRTYFFINSLELSSSVVGPDDKISNSYPANLDYHVEAENGLTLTWDAPNNGADSYTVYFDTDEEAVTNGIAASETLQTTSFTKTGLSPLNRYYWRVDVVRDGETYQGDVWSFQPRRLAFPGADGAGKYAVGGRGYNGNGDVYHVKNLNDSGEGSLRYGIESATGPRTIVFDVAGVITLTSDLKCNKPNITVAGQTAPGIGILLRDDSYSADSEDGITRFMRFRFGHGDDWNPESGVGNSNVGNAAGIQTNFHIMDHCLLAWGSDETFASRGAKNITFQHSLIGESLNQNGHDKYYDSEKNPNVQHGYAATIGGETGSYHHNLLAHNEGRNWSMSGGLLGNEFAGKMNIYNNVVYNWHGRTNDGGTHNGNFVNNYYKMMTTAENSNTEKYIFIATHEDDYQGSQEYYVAGNIRRNKDGSETSDAEGVTYKNEFKNGMSIDYDDFKDVPYDCWNVESKSVSEIESAQSAFKNVLSDVGCNFQQLDNNEKRLIEETLKGTYSKTGSRSGLKGHIDKESDSEGWNGLGMIEAERPSGWDTDKDGIPAWFETAMGWKDAAANNNADIDGDYWTDLEEYLNWVAEPHFYNMDGDGNISAIKNGTITLSDYFAGYTSPTYTVADAGGLTVTISDGTLTYSATQPLESPLVTVKVTATESGISLTREFNIYVEVDVEEKEYSLSQETYSYSNNTTTWYFENGFTVTNNDGKGKSNGSDNTIKYSNGKKFTINIPDGMSVNRIKFYGYANNESSEGYLSELNGTSYTATDYVFPSKSNRAEHIITFAEPVTNTITFTFTPECALAITLYATGGTEVEETDLAPAFPGAEGHGRYAQGGRGTDGFTNVYHVTSLADDGSEGTLRWALAQDGPRTIVFDVSGYIDLTDDLQIPSYTTIAGQTAPEPGITLRYYTVNTNNSKNVIIRYMRFRRSQVKDVDDGADAAYGKNGKNIILDHCSFSWSIDEVASFYDNRNFTMQWCVLGEGLCNSGHTKGGHSYGGIWGGKNASFHHNMITNVQNRAPRLCGARYNWSGYDTSKYSNSVQAEQVDVRNNLYYNWGNGNGAYGGMGGYHNLVNNYYKAGPGTKNTSRVFQGSANSSGDSNGLLPDGLPGRFYIDGNYVTAQSAIYDWSGFIQDSGTGVNTTDLTYTDSQGLYDAAGATVSIKLDNEVDMADVTTHTAEDAYNKILAYGGASLYRDAVDERFMTDATNGTTSYRMTETTDGEGKAVTEFTEGIVDKINDPAAVAVAEQPSFPMLAVVERPANWDTDRDGMPDAWEDANGLDKNNAADGNLYTLDSERKWYTNLEVYLNSIVEDITKAQTEGATIEIDEYYPDWTKPTAESLTEFVLSNETHSSGSANVWTFSNGFGVTGDANRKYANASDYIKYSRNYEYTISVPSNVTVYKVKIEGYANQDAPTTSYLAAFGTQTFDETRYVFPSRNASVNRASYEFTLPEAVTGGTLKIQATGAETCMIVTLYGEEKSYDLDEVANTSNTANATVEGTITWNFEGKETSEFATCGEASENIADYMRTISLAAGSGFDSEYATDANWATKIIQKINNTGTNLDITNPYPVEYNGKKVYQALVRPASQVNSADEDHKLTFTFNTVSGCTFQPTNVNLKMSKYITSGGDALVKLNDTNVETIETVNSATCQPIDGNISSGADGQYSQVNKNVSASASVNNSLYVYFYNLSKDKCAGIGDVVISGNLTYPKTTVTLDEMATVHSLDAADNVTVEMKRGLTAGAWNTFCVPFNLTKTELEAALDDDVEVVKYTKQEGTTLYFEDIENTENIEAGTPYLIKPAKFSRTYDECKTTPITFEGVNLEAADVNSNNREVASEVRPSAADYSFVGTYVRYIMETDGTELGLNSKNKLAKPAASTNIMRGLRGFFRYNAGNGAGAKVVINGTLTSIDEIDGGTAGAKGVYHVSGRYVRSEWNNGSGLPRGLYIVNGQKMVK